MKTLGGEQHVIKAYKFATFEIFMYCMPKPSLHIESTDSITYLDCSSTQVCWSERWFFYRQMPCTIDSIVSTGYSCKIVIMCVN